MSNDLLINFFSILTEIFAFLVEVLETSVSITFPALDVIKIFCDALRKWPQWRINLCNIQTYFSYMRKIQNKNIPNINKDNTNSKTLPNNRRMKGGGRYHPLNDENL